MFKVAVVSDDPLYALELDLMLTALKYRVLIIETANVKAVINLIDDELPDIVLTDVFFASRPVGLILAKEFVKRNIAYILYTSNDQPGIFDVAGRLRPYAYLVRPFNSVTLDRSIKLALIHHTKRRNVVCGSYPFSAKNPKGDLVKSDFADVIAIEIIGNYCYFHLAEEKLVTRTSLVKLMNVLPGNMFLRVHRRYLVARRLIKRINSSKAKVYVLENGYPIGAKYSRGVSDLMEG
jgi:DNA-binding LytR/AlgR family response regulator